MAAFALTTKEKILRAIRVDESGCWRWQLSVNNFGYGRLNIKIDGKSVHTTAHRAAYREFRGDIPNGMDIDHLCRVRDCVNPDHLEAVTRSENLRRSPHVGHIKGSPHRKTHCVHGHEFTDANTIVRASASGTHRFCRQCHVDRIASCPTGRSQALRESALIDATRAAAA